MRHVAIIPDGNRRWAAQRNKPEYAGHEEGARTAEKIFEIALEAGVSCLTFWGLSRDNLQKRPAVELQLLFALFATEFTHLLTSEVIEKHRVRVRFVGGWETEFPTSLTRVMWELQKKTAGNAARNLTFLMAYNGYDEMLSAIRALPKEIPADAAALKGALWTRDLPPVDLVIRTGGEPHLSNGFMMWDIGDAFVHFTETLWPAFSPEEFLEILKKFSGLERRFGK